MKCQDHKTKDEVKHLLDKLKESGCRITTQRKDLAQSIVQLGRPFNAEELHSKVKNKGIDLVTVCRSLTTFTDLELLTTVDFNDGTVRYEYLSSHHKDHHHHHVICKKCKKVEPVNFCAVKEQEKLIQKMGYTNISHKLEFFCLCQKCS